MSKLMKWFRRFVEYLFRFDEVLDAKMLMEAVEADETKRYLEEIAKELKLN